MLRRLTILKKYVIVVMRDAGLDEMLPTKQEWDLMDELVDLFAEFNEATELMIGESYPTLSMVYPLFQRLYKSVKARRETVESEVIREMCDHLAEDLIDHWIMTVEPSHVVACTWIRDSRHSTSSKIGRSVDVSKR